MMCKDCKCEKATEFYDPHGKRLTASAYCLRCFERAVKMGVKERMVSSWQGPLPIGKVYEGDI